MDPEPTAFLRIPFSAGLLPSSIPSSLLTKLAVVDPAEQQTHRDVPASRSVYASVARLLALQVVPGDARVRFLHHSHGIIPFREDAWKKQFVSLGPPKVSASNRSHCLPRTVRMS